MLRTTKPMINITALFLTMKILCFIASDKIKRYFRQNLPDKSRHVSSPQTWRSGHSCTGNNGIRIDFFVLSWEVAFRHMVLSWR